MKQKKYYKTWKFWITSLLALSASSIITSLTLTSCAANSTVNKNDIVINNQSNDQEFSIDDNKGLTLSVEATSNSGATLCYQWYVNKTNDNISWQKINGATNKTYTVPISDIQNIDHETTWKYKADIYPENNEALRVESKPIPVKIKPPVGGPVPEKPSVPETKPEQPAPTPPATPKPPETTPPVDPDLSPDLPTKPSEPETKPEQPAPTPPATPAPTPPSNDINKPGIVPSPPHNESQGIGARLPLDKNGIVTTKYEQEQWIGDNSLSLLIEAKPNASGIANAVNKLREELGQDINTKKMLDSMVGTISNANNYSYNQFGTGWILDYSNNSNENLTDYYIATNMHVMSSYFELVFDSSRYNVYGYEEPIKVGVRIPFNETTVSNLSVYISQPKYSLKDQKYNGKAYADQLTSQWYKTNVNITNWKESLIPIGAFNTENGTGFEYSQGFDMELTWQYETNPNLKETLYFKSNSNGEYLSNKPSIGNESFQNDIDDFSVFKIGLANNAFDEKIKKNDKNKEMFERMKKLFDTTTIVDVKKESSYISKLNKLLEIVNNKKYTKETIDDLFMFGEAGQITNSNTQISIGGYPLLKDLVQNDTNSYKWQSYTTFNTNTLTGNNIIDYPVQYYNTRNKMGINQYTYKGNMYKIKWKDPNNFILKNVNLLAGSSGGVGIDQDYKLSCINWGTFIHIEYHDGIKYVLDSSSSTGLYSSKDKNSLIWKWVDYVNKNGKQTKLAQLFNNLEKIDYFK